MRYAQLVIGPAGSGKSTYCKNVFEHCQSIGRTVYVVNLDPAADHFEYPVAIDIRELISLEDVLEELKLGPNGGLIYCMEYLEDNLDDWPAEQLEDYIDDDYLIFDCPALGDAFGQHKKIYAGQPGQHAQPMQHENPKVEFFCTVCKAPLANHKQLVDHFGSKHPKEPVPPAPSS